MIAPQEATSIKNWSQIWKKAIIQVAELLPLKVPIILYPWKGTHISYDLWVHHHKKSTIFF